MEDKPVDRVDEILEELALLDSRIDSLLPEFSALAKRAYAKNGARSDQVDFENLGRVLLDLNSKMGALLDEVDKLAETDARLKGVLEARKPLRRREFRVARRDLTDDLVRSTEEIESVLPEALVNVMRIVPSGWLAAEAQNGRFRLQADSLAGLQSLIGTTRVRRPSDALHSFAQAILVARDFLESRPDYDFFSGARFVPEICALGKALPVLAKSAKGKSADRIRRLHKGPSDQVESSIYELLVAAFSIERGRDIEFLDPSGVSKTPDLRVCDMRVPTVIECKMRRPLTDYQLAEEYQIRELFTSAVNECLRKGIFGVFDVDFSVVPDTVSKTEFAESLRRQPLAPGRVKYAWGSVDLHELPSEVPLRATGLHTPAFLEDLFGWNCDLPEFDGMVFRVDDTRELIVDRVQRPLALRWRSTVETARRNKSRTATTLVKEAIDQIPPGEMGLVYVAIWEGSREEIADVRLHITSDEIEALTHRRGISLPLVLVNRLLPRALKGGQPDMIENVVQYLAAYSDQWFMDEFPSLVYTTRRPDTN